MSPLVVIPTDLVLRLLRRIFFFFFFDKYQTFDQSLGLIW